MSKGNAKKEIRDKTAATQRNTGVMRLERTSFSVVGVCEQPGWVWTQGSKVVKNETCYLEGLFIGDCHDGNGQHMIEDSTGEWTRQCADQQQVQ